MSDVIRDDNGRVFDKLRVSITKDCNFKCTYCVSEDFKFDEGKYLPAEEVIHIVSNLINLGVKHIKLTGGEPLVRKGFRDIVKSLSDLNMETLSMTTNAFLLDRYLEFLKEETKLNSLNISLDSLKEKNFNRIARGDYFKVVYNNIMKAKEMGFKIKLNCVLMKGFNDTEIHDFVEFSKTYDIPVRFLELMNIGEGMKYYSKSLLTDDIINIIKEKYKLTPVDAPKDSTSENFYIDDTKKIVGFISSESRDFCKNCSRLRLTAEGNLKICLFKDNYISLVGKTKEEYEQIFAELKPLKPMERIISNDTVMKSVGG